MYLCFSDLLGLNEHVADRHFIIDLHHRGPDFFRVRFVRWIVGFHRGDEGLILVPVCCAQCIANC